jgi:hypothetical protein
VAGICSEQLVEMLRWGIAHRDFISRLVKCSISIHPNLLGDAITRNLFMVRRDYGDMGTVEGIC